MGANFNTSTPNIQCLDSKGKNLYFHQYFDKRVFARKIDGEWCYSFDIKAIASGDGFSVDAIEYAQVFGFVYPPYTIYQNVYSIPPNTYFLTSETEIRLLNVLSSKCTNSGSEFCDFVEKQLFRLVGNIADQNEVVCLFSAGIDSSLLLGILESLKPGQAKALMCDMPSMPTESLKAKRMAADKSIDLEVLNIQSGGYSELISRAVDMLGEPIYDDAALLLYELLESHKDDHGSVYLDGQGADSLFFGLPHNRVFRLYLKYPMIRLISKIFDLLPAFNSRKGPLQRKIYRVRRALTLFSSSDVVQFVTKCLSLPERSVVDIDKKNKIFSSMQADLAMLQSQFKSNQQELLRQVFMLRVLPSRELQKYDLLRKSGYKPCLPFLSKDFVLSMFSCSPESFLVKGMYKYPLYALCKKFWPGYFDKYYTSPFYLDIKSEIGESVLSKSLAIFAVKGGENGG